MRGRRAAVVLGALVAALAGGEATGAGEAGSWSSTAFRLNATPGAAVVVEGVGEFRGTIEVRRSGAGLAVVNELPLEEYLLGLAEVPSTWPAAALEAQAIAARTFALHSQLVRSTAPHRRAGADICATQACQVYRGLERERRDVAGAWAAAVRRTAHRYVLHRGGPILAKYASSNGGRSDPGGAPYLPAVDDPDDVAVSPWARWTSSLPLEQVARAFPGSGRLVEVVRTGDVFVLRREQADGTLVDEGVAPADVRRRLNATAPTPAGLPVPVPSIRFTARTEGDHAVLDGAGYGHLVGMSQYGALGKARRGLSADDILASYYGGLRSQPVQVERLPGTIRVAVDLDAAKVQVRPAGGRLQVVDAVGQPIALRSGGAWSATPAGPSVELVGDHPPVGLEAHRVAPATLQVRITAPALVRVHDPHPREVGVLEAGTHAVPVAEDVELRVEADAGGGRTAVAVVSPVLRVASAAAPDLAFTAGSGDDGPTSRRPPPGIAAVVAALLVALVGAGSGRRLLGGA